LSACKLLIIELLYYIVIYKKIKMFNFMLFSEKIKIKCYNKQRIMSNYISQT